VESLIRAWFPGWALRRAQARQRLDVVERLYQAASPSHLRASPPASRSGNAVTDHARGKLRDWARHLDENHDLTHGALDILARQAANQTLIPTPRARSGAPLEELARRISEEWERWCEGADTTDRQPWGAYCRLVARSWLRDGEAFVLHQEGGPGGLGYSLRTLEADYCPFDVEPIVPPGGEGRARRILHGVELNEEDRPLNYWFYRRHPSGLDLYGIDDLIAVDAASVSHLRTITRLGQLRGTSILAPAVTRIADVAEYEGSEMAAAKVASAVSVAITRSPDFSTSSALSTTSGERSIELQPGMILDNLAPGEKYEVLDTSRPNPELANFRRAMLQAAASGIGVSYSSMARDYAGTYSSQRQELVEARLAYGDLQTAWKAAFLRPVYRRFVAALQRSAETLQIRGFARADPRTLFEFDTVPPAMPWIDPAKEAAADKLALEMRIDSRRGIQRKRGLDPVRVDQENASDTEPGIAAVGEPSNEQSAEADSEA